MSDVKIYPARVTPKCMPSVYGNTPEMRAYEHPEMVSVNVRDLFPEMPEAIYEGDDSDPDVIEKSTREAARISGCCRPLRKSLKRGVTTTMSA